MLARLKSHSSLYTLPVVVLIGFMTVAGLAAWQRSDVIAELADQIAHGEKAEATEAVRELAAIPGPPLNVLVDAASSDERATAEAAQVALNRLLGEWKRQLDKRQRTSRVAAQLTELATQLAAQRRAFATSDYPWLAGVTRKIMRLANQCPAKKTPLVAMHCDAILSAIEAASVNNAVPGQYSRTSKERSAIGNSAAAAVESNESDQERLERQFSAFPAPPIAAGINGEDRDTAPSATGSESTGEDDAPPGPSTSTKPSSDDDGVTSPGLSVRDGKSDSDSPAASPDELAYRPSWSRPAYRMRPKPLASPPADAGLPRPPNPLPDEAVNSTIPAASPRRLMEQWIVAADSANEADRSRLEQLLASRGFKPLPEKLVRFYLSADVEERAHIVDRVIEEPTIDSRPWLALLAEDEDADVRLAAVTMMATSTDRELVEKAWQIVLRDRDPRIADLAGRLRERRAAMQRR